MLHRSRNSRRDFLLDQAPLWVSNVTSASCTELKIIIIIHSAHAESPIVPKQVSLILASNLARDQVYASQIRKLRKRFFGGTFLVEPAPLRASCYIHLLYRAQDGGCNLQVAGCRLQVADCRLQVQVAGCRSNIDNFNEYK